MSAQQKVENAAVFGSGSVAARVPPRELMPGELFGRYEIGALIGIGGMAHVYEAVHVAMKKRVALKVLREEVLSVAHARERFLREGEAAARIQHPNVVDIFDVGTFGGLPYLVMERLQGESLADVLDRQPRLEVQQLLQIVLPVCAGVGAGHDRGVIHRDLKPENIFLAAHGPRRTVPKVLDFGVSRVVTDLNERLTLDTSVLGTPFYMSPEQARGERMIDGRTDQYSLAVIMYEAAVGRLPRDNPSVLKLIHEVACGGFDPPRLHNPALSPEFEAVLLRAMSDLPKDRYESMRALGAALLPFASLRAREYWAPELAALSATPMPHNVRPEFGSIATPGMESVNPSLPSLPNIERSITDAPPPLLPTAKPTASTQMSRRLGMVALLAVACAGLAAWRLLPVRATSVEAADAAPVLPAAPRTFNVSLRVVPESARIELDGKPVGTGALTMELSADGTMHSIRIMAADHETQVISFRDAPPPGDIVLRATTHETVAAPTLSIAAPPVSPPRRVGSWPPQKPGAASTSSAAPARPTATSTGPRPSASGHWPAAPASDNRNPWSN